MEFTYRKVVDGQVAALLTELRDEIEARIPNHQQIIAKTMWNFGLKDWNATFCPLSPKGGLAVRLLRLIILSSNAPTKEMLMETLYHEIFHVKFPEETESVIEKMGVEYAGLINKAVHGG